MSTQQVAVFSGEPNLNRFQALKLNESAAILKNKVKVY